MPQTFKATGNVKITTIQAMIGGEQAYRVTLKQGRKVAGALTIKASSHEEAARKMAAKVQIELID